jgi:uncharacterized phage protein (TIGR02218 family)
VSSVATTRARLWSVTRRDGAVFGFTDHDRDLIMDGVTFRAGTGLNAGAIERSTGLAVDNASAAGALSDAGITEADIGAGRFDGAAVTAWEADWQDLSDRRMTFRGTFGEVTRGGCAFEVELRGLSEVLNRPRGRVFQNACPAVLGDADCGIDLGAEAFSVELLVEAAGEAELSWTSFGTYAPGWFERGRIVMLDGAAKGLSEAVRRDVEDGAGRRLELWARFAISPAAGDRVRIEAGCDKRFPTCRAKFDNARRFRGFPDIPGEDWLQSYPTAQGGNDGGSLRS